MTPSQPTPAAVSDEHSPLPWTYFVGNANGRGLIRIECGLRSTDAGHHIASMPRGPRSAADAKLLTEAVNSSAAQAQRIEKLETALGWSETLPAEEGWYWRWRSTARLPGPRIVEVYRGVTGILHYRDQGAAHRLDDEPALWSAKIKEPK